MFTVIIQNRCISSFVLIGCSVSELHAHLCPYRSVTGEIFTFLSDTEYLGEREPVVYTSGAIFRSCPILCNSIYASTRYSVPGISRRAYAYTAIP